MYGHAIQVMISLLFHGRILVKKVFKLVERVSWIHGCGSGIF